MLRDVFFNSEEMVWVVFSRQVREPPFAATLCLQPIGVRNTSAIVSRVYLLLPKGMFEQLEKRGRSPGAGRNRWFIS